VLQWQGLLIQVLNLYVLQLYDEICASYKLVLLKYFWMERFFYLISKENCWCQTDYYKNLHYVLIEGMLRGEGNMFGRRCFQVNCINTFDWAEVIEDILLFKILSVRFMWSKWHWCNYHRKTTYRNILLVSLPFSRGAAEFFCIKV